MRNRSLQIVRLEIVTERKQITNEREGTLLNLDRYNLFSIRICLVVIKNSNAEFKALHAIIYLQLYIFYIHPTECRFKTADIRHSSDGMIPHFRYRCRSHSQDHWCPAKGKTRLYIVRALYVCLYIICLEILAKICTILNMRPILFL